MGDNAVRAIAAFAASIIGLAIWSVIFSPNSQAANVIGTAGQAFASIIGAATAPVSGGSVAGTVNYTGVTGIGLNNPLSLGLFAGGALVGGASAIGNLAGGLGSGSGSGANQNVVDSGSFDPTFGGATGGSTGVVDSGTFAD